VALPENGNWAETEQWRQMLAHLREMMESMKASGLDVSELEEFLKSPNLTWQGVESHHEVFLKRMGAGQKGRSKGFASFESPHVISEERYYRFESKSDNIDSRQKAGSEQTAHSKCPTCGKMVDPQWKSCPFCRSGLPVAGPPSETPETGRWAETKEGQKRLADLQHSLEVFKSDGHDVSELEEYLKSPDITPAGVNSRLFSLIERINKRTHEGRECPRCFADLAPDDKRCPSCGAKVERPGETTPTEHCPKCQGRVGPKDRKCPTCGHRLRPWSLFS
jgi:hypothetical protein